MSTNLAYMPLVTHPEPVGDEAVGAAVEVAAALGCDIKVVTFAAVLPRVSTPVDGLLINIPEMIRAAEESSRNHCSRLHELVLARAGSRIRAHGSTREAPVGTEGSVAAVEARYHDLALLPLSSDSAAAREHAQEVVFGAGRPAVLVPPSARPGQLKRVAVAWDGSRVAARALADVRAYLNEDTELTVLTIRDEKPLAEDDIAAALRASLEERGFRAEARNVALGRRKIAEALQEAALEVGAEMLVMGGFGHSRIRDFILGGATQGVFADPRLPILLSH